MTGGQIESFYNKKGILRILIKISRKQKKVIILRAPSFVRVSRGDSVSWDEKYVYWAPKGSSLGSIKINKIGEDTEESFAKYQELINRVIKRKNK